MAKTENKMAERVRISEMKNNKYNRMYSISFCLWCRCPKWHSHTDLLMLRVFCSRSAFASHTASEPLFAHHWQSIFQWCSSLLLHVRSCHSVVSHTHPLAMHSSVFFLVSFVCLFMSCVLVKGLRGDSTKLILYENTIDSLCMNALNISLQLTIIDTHQVPGCAWKKKKAIKHRKICLTFVYDK